MNDATFIAQLFSVHLLPGNIKNQLKSMRTRAEKAMHLLDYVIQPSVMTGIGSSFNDLIKVMENGECDGLKELAKLIRCRLRKQPANSETGYIRWFVILTVLYSFPLNYKQRCYCKVQSNGC